MSLHPDDSHGIASISVVTERALARAGHRSRRFLRLEVQARESSGQNVHTPVHLGIALDRSGSMAGERMALARQAAIAAISLLKPGDAFHVCAFDNVVEVVARAPSATPAARARAMAAIERVEARSSTALYEGWRTAMTAVLPREGVSNRLSRCLLVTDGHANIGPADAATLGSRAREAREQGVTTSTFGIGDGYDEAVLGKMASEGGGSFYHVTRAEELPELLTADLRDVLEVAAREVRIELRPSPGIRLDAVSRFPCRWTGSALRIELGHLAARQTVEVIVAVTLPEGREGEVASVEATAFDAEGPVPLPIATAAWSFADPHANASQPIDAACVLAISRVLVHRAILEALDLNRQGRFDAVQEVLERTRGEVAPFLAVPGIGLVLDELARRTDLARPVPPPLFKEVFAAAMFTTQSRAETGKSRR